MSEILTKPRTFQKHPSAARTYGFDFTPLLPTGVTLTGTPTVEAVSGITFGSPTINGSTFTDPDGTTIAANKGVTFRISGGTAGSDYTVNVHADFSNGDSDNLVATVQVRSS